MELTVSPWTATTPGDGLVVREKSNGTGDGVPPSAGAQAERGAPRPAPRVPPEAETACHFERSQLSTTFRAPKIRSMSLAQGTSFESGAIEKPRCWRTRPPRF